MRENSPSVWGILGDGSQKPAVQVVDAKACFSSWFFCLFCLERSALQNFARRRQLFVRKKRCTLGLELAIVLSELWFVLLVQCRTQRTPLFFLESFMPKHLRSIAVCCCA